MTYPKANEMFGNIIDALPSDGHTNRFERVLQIVRASYVLGYSTALLSYSGTIEAAIADATA